MKPFNYEELQDTQLIDIRPQVAFRESHIKNSLNLIPRNFERYSEFYLDKEEPFIFVIDENNKENLDEAVSIANQKKLTNLLGYIFLENVPEKDLLSLESAIASEFLDNEEDYILLDVRHPNEITRPAPKQNLITIPFEELKDNLTEMDQNKKIYTLCGSGNRSTAAASYLESQGYSTVVIENGIASIQEEQKKRSSDT